MMPFKVVAYEPGAAHVTDRDTGTKIGFVFQDYNGSWHPGGTTWPDSVRFRTRLDAVTFVWSTYWAGDPRPAAPRIDS